MKESILTSTFHYEYPKSTRHVHVTCTSGFISKIFCFSLSITENISEFQIIDSNCSESTTSIFIFFYSAKDWCKIFSHHDENIV